MSEQSKEQQELAGVQKQIEQTPEQIMTYKPSDDELKKSSSDAGMFGMVADQVLTGGIGSLFLTMMDELRRKPPSSNKKLKRGKNGKIEEVDFDDDDYLKKLDMTKTGYQVVGGGKIDQSADKKKDNPLAYDPKKDDKLKQQGKFDALQNPEINHLHARLQTAQQQANAVKKNMLQTPMMGSPSHNSGTRREERDDY